MVNPEQALVLMLKGLRIFYLVIRVLYHQLKELQNLMTGSTKFGNVYLVQLMRTTNFTKHKFLFIYFLSILPDKILEH